MFFNMRRPSINLNHSQLKFKRNMLSEIMFYNLNNLIGPDVKFRSYKIGNTNGIKFKFVIAGC